MHERRTPSVDLERPVRVNTKASRSRKPPGLRSKIMSKILQLRRRHSRGRRSLGIRPGTGRRSHCRCQVRCCCRNMRHSRRTRRAPHRCRRNRSERASHRSYNRNVRCCHDRKNLRYWHHSECGTDHRRWSRSTIHRSSNIGEPRGGRVHRCSLRNQKVLRQHKRLALRQPTLRRMRSA